ncbi:hypothetical protein COCMIDRAFT_90494 [Bipolaris oryzae ATCC 44560]|uniref:Uncharacterized protein n=1 Tax=Bipolaris oryzae ATCC 44560 TaxID=930090 RepID=W6Z6H5_COCMI|nr:uncharacterized protein COCMIDRAFT_90494 [Bipolaris oryzae ATCC 44560]EUC47332.1 hypothetical protein COCMIDRAFT_90494 [Bipolaris oryzae ATCC 44560]
MGFRQKPTPEYSKDIGYLNPEFFLRSSTSSDEGPRIVPPEIAAKRIGNPPRRAALPVPRPGAINNILNPPSDRPAFRPLEPDSISSYGNTLKGNDMRTTSPKLHYLHGLPDSKAYPYVHKKEVKEHLAAIDAGLSSPLAQFAFTVNQQKERNRYTDFSETIFYGNNPSPALVSDVHRLFPEQSRHSNVVVEHVLVVGGPVVPKQSRAQHHRSIDEQLYDSNAYARKSPALQAPQSRNSRPCSRNKTHSTTPICSTDENSRRNERSTHKPGPGPENIPRLRGGAGTNQACLGYGFLFKQLLLTCHRPEYDSSSDTEDSPVRIPDPAQISRAMRRAQGTATLPKNLSRTTATSSIARSSSSNAHNNTLPPSRTATFTATYTPPRPLLCNMPCIPCASPIPSPTQPRTQDSLINSTYPLYTPPTTIPCLRGGGGSPSALRDEDNLPPTLVWLAGRKRRSITTKTWKEGKPKVRMGGMLGWAVYGARAGEVRGQEMGEGKNAKSAGGGGVAKVKESAPKEMQKGPAEEKKESVVQDPVPEVAAGDAVPSANEGGAEK